jgi:predicted transcriptional regulator
MKRTERLALEELSLKAYGTRTRYKKMMERGIRMEIKDQDGRKYEGYQRFDAEEIQAVMEEEIEEKAKKLAEKLEKEKEQANVGNESTGLANTNT